MSEFDPLDSEDVGFYAFMADHFGGVWTPPEPEDDGTAEVVPFDPEDAGFEQFMRERFPGTPLPSSAPTIPSFPPFRT